MRILYLSYFYPPLGGPAAIRNAKTVKYLSRAGCKIDVITVGELEYNTFDPSLLEENAAGRVQRVQSWDPMSILKKISRKGALDSNKIYFSTPEKIKKFLRNIHPIDDKIGWVYPVVIAGIKSLSSRDYDLIYVSCGPFSSALAAYYLSRKFGIPFVIDYRDYWTLLSDYDREFSFLHRILARHWEKRILGSAKLVVTATNGIGRDLANFFGDELQARLCTTLNGWDDEDYTELDLVVERDTRKFVISYFGVIYARRSLKNLLLTIRSIRDEKLCPVPIELQLFGNYYPETYTEIKDTGMEEGVRIRPPLPHKEALQEMLKSDMLLLIINSSSPYGTLTSKIFEYIRLKRPILALAPRHGEASELLSTCKHNYTCSMESPSDIRQTLLKAIRMRNRKRTFFAPPVLERSRQIGNLYERLRAITRD